MTDSGKRQLGWTGSLPVILLLLVHPAAAVAGTGRLLSQWMSQAPGIDAQLAAGEWSAAQRVDLTADVSIWIGNDARTLYLAVLDAGDLGSAGLDMVFLAFDDEGGVAPTLDDSAYANPACLTTPNLGEGGLTFQAGGNVQYDERFLGGACPGQIISTRLRFVSSPQPAGMTYEMAIPLDGPSPLRAGAGQRFGFRMRTYRDGALVACYPDCIVIDPPGFRNLVLASGGCNTGPQTFDSGLPLDSTNVLFTGSGVGWQSSTLSGDPTTCQGNATGGSGSAGCVANAFYTAAHDEADLHLPLAVTGQSTATLHFKASFAQGAASDGLVATTREQDLTYNNLLAWVENHPGEPVGLAIDLLSPPYLGNPPVELLIGQITFTAGGVQGGYAEIDDFELTCGPVLFSDGFESGLTTHWSTDVP